MRQNSCSFIHELHMPNLFRGRVVSECVTTNQSWMYKQYWFLYPIFSRLNMCKWNPSSGTPRQIFEISQVIENPNSKSWQCRMNRNLVFYTITWHAQLFSRARCHRACVNQSKLDGQVRLILQPIITRLNYENETPLLGFLDKSFWFGNGIYHKPRSAEWAELFDFIYDFCTCP